MFDDYEVIAPGRLDEKVGLRSENVLAFTCNALKGAIKEKTDHEKEYQ